MKRWTVALVVILVACSAYCSATVIVNRGSEDKHTGPAMVVFGYNDLGMHCMNQDFSALMILPPYNTLHAQVIDRTGKKPRIVTSGITVTYTIPGNTHSYDKTNFWQYVQDLLGVSLPLDVGLSGNTLWGTMRATIGGDWCVSGIPLTPLTDQLIENPFQLASIAVVQGRTVVARTQAVVPVSWDIQCAMCHNGNEVEANPVAAHNRKHPTYNGQPMVLDTTRPVLCGSCHAQPELGLPGNPNISTLSHAMHSAHSTRMGDVSAMLNGVTCYACHPGPNVHCLRDIHAKRKMNCMNCHTSMEAVADPNRRPWVDLPRCDNCHHKRGFDYEQPNTLYRNSKGHGGVFCEACHNTPHAITPTTNPQDNVQSLLLQGKLGAIKKCEVCHDRQPSGPFIHRVACAPPIHR